MPTDRISPSTPLVETLRALARGRAQDTQRTGQPGKLEPDEQQSPITTKHDVQALRHRLRHLAKETDLADTQSMLQARTHVVREILLWEFGNDFRNDSQFVPMLEAISGTLDADEAFQQRFTDLMVDLRKF